MKKRMFLSVLIMSVMIISIYLFLNKLVLTRFYTTHFILDYSKDFETVSKSEDNIILATANESLLQVRADKYEKSKKKMTKEEIYRELEKQFHEKNAKFSFINHGNTVIGKKYIDSYEFLYETTEQQMLYIITIKDDYILRIIFTAKNKIYDIDLNKSYSIINSIELK